MYGCPGGRGGAGGWGGQGAGGSGGPSLAMAVLGLVPEHRDVFFKLTTEVASGGLGNFGAQGAEGIIETIHVFEEVAE